MAGEPNNSPCLRLVIKDPYKNSQVRDSSVGNISPNMTRYEITLLVLDLVTNEQSSRTTDKPFVQIYKNKW